MPCERRRNGCLGVVIETVAGAAATRRAQGGSSNYRRSRDGNSMQVGAAGPSLDGLPTSRVTTYTVARVPIVVAVANVDRRWQQLAEIVRGTI